MFGHRSAIGVLLKYDFVRITRVSTKFLFKFTFNKGTKVVLRNMLNTFIAEYISAIYKYALKL